MYPYALEVIYPINTLVINKYKQLDLTGLLGMLQDAAWQHADKLGYGYTDLGTQQLFWVLSRQHVQITRWPKWGETLKIVTWPSGIESIFAKRDFEIWVDDTLCGVCTTDWLMVDVNTKRPVRPQFKPEMEFGPRTHNQINTAKINQAEQEIKLSKFAVKYSDIDVNQHVNNAKYAQWILDVLPADFLSKHRITGYEVNFNAEATWNDEIELSCDKELNTIETNYQFWANIKSDGKQVFVAKLTTKTD